MDETLSETTLLLLEKGLKFSKSQCLETLISVKIFL